MGPCAGTDAASARRIGAVWAQQPCIRPAKNHPEPGFGELSQITHQPAGAEDKYRPYKKWGESRQPGRWGVSPSPASPNGGLR